MFKEEVKLALDRLWLDEREQEFPWPGLSRKGERTHICSVPSVYQTYFAIHLFFSR